MTVQFGPAGNSDSFYASGHKSSLETFPWLREQGLDVYEYQCGHGARIREETARQLGDKARECGIGVSLHAPYYISLASKEEEKRLNSLTYILQSARIVDWMGGRRIVVHPGGLGGLSRAGAAALAMDTLRRAQEVLDLSRNHGKNQPIGRFRRGADLLLGGRSVFALCGFRPS